MRCIFLLPAWLTLKLAVCCISKVYFTYGTVCAAITSFYFRRQGEWEWSLVQIQNFEHHVAPFYSAALLII